MLSADLTQSLHFQVLQEIELSLREEKGKVYKSHQRLLYDLDIVPEVIS